MPSPVGGSMDWHVKGAEELGVPFEEHVANVVEGLKTVRGELGL